MMTGKSIAATLATLDAAISGAQVAVMRTIGNALVGTGPVLDHMGSQLGVSRLPGESDRDFGTRIRTHIGAPWFPVAPPPVRFDPRAFPKPRTVDEGLNTLNAMARIGGGGELMKVYDKLTDKFVGAYIRGAPGHGGYCLPIAFDARRMRFVVDPDPTRFFVVMLGRHRVLKRDNRPVYYYNGADPAHPFYGPPT